MSEDEDTAATVLGSGLGSVVGSGVAGIGSFTLGGLALAAGVGAAVGYGSYLDTARESHRSRWA